MKVGTKHLLQCHCILPQYRGRIVPIFHKFVVFSIIENDKIVSKIVECNNCGAVHKITEISKSEIVIGREDLKSRITKEDIKINLPESISKILESYNVDLPTWEEVQFIIEEAKWGSEIILTRETVDQTTQGKLLRILNPIQVKIESFTREEIAGE